MDYGYVLGCSKNLGIMDEQRMEAKLCKPILGRKEGRREGESNNPHRASGENTAFLYLARFTIFFLQHILRINPW